MLKFIIFRRKEIGAKAARNLLVKLTLGLKYKYQPMCVCHVITIVAVIGHWTLKSLCIYKSRVAQSHFWLCFPHYCMFLRCMSCLCQLTTVLPKFKNNAENACINRKCTPDYRLYQRNKRFIFEFAFIFRMWQRTSHISGRPFLSSEVANELASEMISLFHNLLKSNSAIPWRETTVCKLAETLRKVGPLTSSAPGPSFNNHFIIKWLCRKASSFHNLCLICHTI